MAGLTCPNGHQIRGGNQFCTTCGQQAVATPEPAGTPDAPTGGKNRIPVVPVVVAIVVVVALAGIAFFLGRRTGNEGESKPTRPPATASTISTAPVVTVPSSQPTTTVPLTTTTTTLPRSSPTTTTSALIPRSGTADTEADAARSAAVVYFTYGVTANGYPSLEAVVAPPARPALVSDVIGSDYSNAGCTQIVQDITETNGAPAYFEFELMLSLRCPDGPPASADGIPLSLTLREDISVTTAPNPAGGYWATQILLFGQE